MTPEQIAEKKRKNAERAKKWREAHPDYMKQYMKPYREKNGDKMRAADRLYNAEHREEKNAYRRQWAKDHPERDRAATVRWRTENPDKWRDSRLRRLYGITLEQYRAQMEKQGHACAICKKKFESEFGKDVHVDHDHKTGEFRGLLCHEHNTMLGLAQDEIQVLLNAIAYLQAPSCELQKQDALASAGHSTPPAAT